MADPIDAAPAAPAPDTLADLSADARAQWRLTGELPKPAETPTPDTPETPAVEPAPAPAIPSTDADSSPAQPAEQAASTDATSPATSEAATPTRKNAETRIKELLAQNKRLQEHLDRALSSPQSPAASDGSAASSPAPPVQLDSLIARPDVEQPPLAESAFFEQFPQASLADFVDYRASYRHAKASAEQAVVSAWRAKEQTYGQRIAAVRQADPELFDQLPEAVVSAVPIDLLPPNTAPTAWNYAAQAIVESEQAGAILAHLAAHPDAVDAVSRATSPSHAIRLIATMEARLTPASVPSGSPVSLAPTPPAKLGTKPAQPADELQDALRRGDFDAYRRLANRKEMQSA